MLVSVFTDYCRPWCNKRIIYLWFREKSMTQICLLLCRHRKLYMFSMESSLIDWQHSLLGYNVEISVIFHQSKTCLAHKHRCVLLPFADRLKWIAYWKGNKFYPKRADKTSFRCWIRVIDKYVAQLNGKGVLSVITRRYESVLNDVTFRAATASKFRKRDITCEVFMHCQNIRSGPTGSQ